MWVHHDRSHLASNGSWRGAPSQQISTEASRRRLTNALSSPSQGTDDRDLRFVTNALELQLFDALDDEGRVDELRAVAAETFQIARTLAWPEEPVVAAQWLVRLGCIAVLGDRSADFRRIVKECELPALSPDSADWGVRVWSSVLHVWLRLLRKKGVGRSRCCPRANRRHSRSTGSYRTSIPERSRGSQGCATGLGTHGPVPSREGC